MTDREFGRRRGSRLRMRSAKLLYEIHHDVNDRLVGREPLPDEAELL
jgi:hypothetical protein